MTLIDSNISHEESFLIDNVLKEYNNVKKEIKDFLHTSLSKILAYI